MPLERQEVAALLMRARAFYKGGLKSANKVYDHEIESDKHRRRERNAERADPLIVQIRSTLRLNENSATDILRYGRELCSRNIKIGNCEEMTAVVLWLSMHQEFRPRFVDALRVKVGRAENSHVFSVFVDETYTGTIPNRQTLRQLAAVGSSGIWVVDCWMNVVCLLHEYMEQAWVSLMRWESQGKHPVNTANTAFFASITSKPMNCFSVIHGTGSLTDSDSSGSGSD